MRFLVTQYMWQEGQLSEGELVGSFTRILFYGNDSHRFTSSSSSSSSSPLRYPYIELCFTLLMRGEISLPTFPPRGFPDPSGAQRPMAFSLFFDFPSFGVR